VGFEDAVNGGEGGLEKALVTGRYRENTMREIGVFLAFGQVHNERDFLRSDPMPCEGGTRFAVAKL